MRVLVQRFSLSTVIILKLVTHSFIDRHFDGPKEKQKLFKCHTSEAIKMGLIQIL